MTPRMAILTFGWLALWVAPAIAADEVEVLARGPVHEAYAEPHESQPKATPIIAKEPPKPVEELPPDQKPEGENVQWLPGYWSYDEDRKDYLWVSGFWRVAPPGRTWVAGSWRKVGDGWQWSGGLWAGAQEQKAEIEYLPQPPAPLDDAGASTPAASETDIYVPGNWVYRERYVWRPGYWSAYRPNWVWTAAHYRWTPGGHVFIEGYWDYPLASRGILFAPAYIPSSVYLSSGYVYTPTVIIREPCLYGALFVRRGWGSYYFGDYFEPRYASLGFVSWNGYSGASVQIGGWYDPLFSYYRVGYRDDPYWGGGGIGNLYAGRYRGDYVRPPITFSQQRTVINNITNNNTTIVNNNAPNLNNVSMLTTLKDAPKSTAVRLHAVSDTSRREQQVAARGLRDAGVQRGAQESLLAARTPAAKLDAPRSLKLDVPKAVVTKVNASEIPKAGIAVRPTEVPPPPTPVRVTPRAKVDPKIGTPPAKVDPKIGTPPAKVDPKGVTIPPRIDPKITPNPVPVPKVVPKGPVPMPTPVAPPRVVPVAPPKVEPAPRPMPTPPPVNVAPPAPRPAPVVAPPPPPRPAPPPAPAPKSSPPEKPKKGGK